MTVAIFVAVFIVAFAAANAYISSSVDRQIASTITRLVDSHRKVMSSEDADEVERERLRWKRMCQRLREMRGGEKYADYMEEFLDG